jgi:hypothetical protein
MMRLFPATCVRNNLEERSILPVNHQTHANPQMNVEIRTLQNGVSFFCVSMASRIIGRP